MGTKNVLVGTVRVNEAVISDTASLTWPGLVDTAGLGATTGPTPLWEPLMSEKMDRSALPSDEAEMAERDSFERTEGPKEREAEGRGVTRGSLTALSVTVKVCTTVVEPDSSGTVAVAVIVLRVG